MSEEQQQYVKFDGYDNALVGVASVWDTSGNQEERLVYSGEAILTILIHRDGMSYEEAMEFISFNIERAYIGPLTPIVVWEATMEEIEGAAE